MSEQITTPLQDEITRFLTEHPLSSAKDTAKGIGRKATTVGVMLLTMFRDGKVAREQDEEHVFRYVLADKPMDLPTPAFPPETEDEESRSRAIATANAYSHLWSLASKAEQYIYAHPNVTATEIADAIEEDYYEVGGYLMFEFSRKDSVLRRSIDEKGTIRYTYVPREDEPSEKKLVKVKTLDDFTPREMFSHLKKLGYKWKPQTLYHEQVIRNYVEFENI